MICNLRRQWHRGLPVPCCAPAETETADRTGRSQQIMTTTGMSPLWTEWFDAHRETMESAGSVTRSVREPLYDLGQTPRLGTGTRAAVRRAMCQ